MKQATIDFAFSRQQQINRSQNISIDHHDNSFEQKYDKTDKNQRFKHSAAGPSSFNRFKPSQEPNPPADTRPSSLKHVNNQSDDQQRRISYKAIRSNIQSQTQQTTTPVLRFTIKNDKYVGDAQSNESNPSNTKPYEHQIESQQHSQTHTRNVHARLEHVNKFQDYELYNESTQQRFEPKIANVIVNSDRSGNHRVSVHNRLGNQTRNEPSDTKANRSYTGNLNSRLVDQQPSVRDADYAEPNRQMRHRLGNNSIDNTNWNYAYADDSPSTIDLKQTISFRNSNLKNHSKDFKKPEFSNNAERFDAGGKCKLNGGLGARCGLFAKARHRN